MKQIKSTIPGQTLISNRNQSDLQASNGAKPLASLSLDLDNKWSYMKTYGDSEWKNFPSYFDIVVPSILEVLKRLNLKITFFIIGQDAVLDKNRDALRSITENGHEVGNHSFNHEPWLHLCPEDQIKREVLETEEQINRVTGQKPIGFRGPGFVWGTNIIKVLAENEYLYDASILPTYLGPLGRVYLFRNSNLSREEKKKRNMLFGNIKDSLKPIKPYYFQLKSGFELLEIPVTTMPILKIPFHLSYLIYLSSFSFNLMTMYLKLSLFMCRITYTEPSFLLHSLDFAGADVCPGLSFFPGMNLNKNRKIKLCYHVLKTLSDHFDINNMSNHAKSFLKNKNIRSLPV